MAKRVLNSRYQSPQDTKDLGSTAISGGQISMPPSAAETAENENVIALPAATEIVLTVEEAAERLRIGRTKMYSLVSKGEIESVQIGSLRRIPVSALHLYVQQLVTQQNNRIAA
ncbi:MAG: helix-turn-helix domain-containing protein [Stackebrandtia sp.]